MPVFVLFNYQKEIGQVGRDIFLNRRIDRHPQLNSKKRRPLHPPPVPPMELPLVTIQPKHHHFQAKHSPVQIQPTSTMAIDRIRRQPPTDFVNQYDEPIPR